MTISAPTDGYVLYGNQLSYFSKKLEAAMQFYSAQFEFRSKSAAVRDELEQRAGTHQIPVLHTRENWMLADTTPTMTALDARFPSRRMYPAGPLGVLVHVIEDWFDEWIPRTAVHYRWHHPESAAWAAPRIAAETVPGDEEMQTNVAAMIASWGARACRATGTDSETQQKAAEEEYARILRALETQLGESRYALGDRPCAVDAVLLGGLRAHFAADPVPKRLVAKYQRVSDWMKNTDWDGTGELAAFPESTTFARFVVAEMTEAYRSFVLGNAEALASGTKAFVATVHEEEVSYLARPYPERSRAMVHDRIRSLAATERSAVTAWLTEVGLADVFAPAA